MVATHRDPCPRCGAMVCAPVGRDLIVARARVLRRIRARRRVTVGVAAACVGVLSAAAAVAWASGGAGVAGGVTFLLSFAMVSGAFVVADYPDRWWADVFGLTDVDAEVEP